MRESGAERPATVVALVDEGVEVLVDRTVPLHRATEALGSVAAGRARGELIVVPSPGS
jgi:hypothetical protein